MEKDNSLTDLAKHDTCDIPFDALGIYIKVNAFQPHFLGWWNHHLIMPHRNKMNKYIIMFRTSLPMFNMWFTLYSTVKELWIHSWSSTETTLSVWITQPSNVVGLFQGINITSLPVNHFVNWLYFKLL